MANKIMIACLVLATLGIFGGAWAQVNVWMNMKSQKAYIVLIVLCATGNVSLIALCIGFYMGYFHL